MVAINIRDKLDGTELDLSMMSLKEVPLKDIVSVSRATSIDLSSNLLKGLPPNFGSQLSHIIKLNLSANKITALPKSFYQLANLRHLDLYNNQLTDLPASLHHLTKLKFLDIKNNPLKPELQEVVGDCLTRKECETSAKRLVAHFTKQKQLAIEQEVMANKAKEAREQQQREEAEAARRMNEKKAAKKERKNENKAMKQQVQHQQHEQQQHRQATSNSVTNNKTTNGGLNKTVKRPNKSNKGGWCSCMSLINMMLLICITGAAGWCLHLHLEGDYSQAGLQAAMPKMQKSLYRLQNMTVEALQPDNLRRTSQVVWKSVNATAYQAAEVTKRTAYATQAYLEVYTGDLSPYTSKVSEWSCCAWAYTKNTCTMAIAWLMSRDWQGMMDVILKFLTNIWTNLQGLWYAALKNPTVAATWSSICAYTSSALLWLQEVLATSLLYLQKNWPVWLEMARDNTYNTMSSIKDSIQSLLK